MERPNEEYGARLIAKNRAMDAAKALSCSLRCARPTRLTCELLPYLLDHCHYSQRREVSYLADEFAAQLPPSLEHEIRQKEYEMYVRFADASGIAKVIRRLEQLDRFEA